MNRQRGSTLKIIRAARMIDGKGREPLTNQAIVVQDGCIRDIKPWGDELVASLNQEAEVLDVGKGATLLPGLIDAHVHLTLNADRSPGEKPTDLPPESDEAILLRAVGNAQAALGAGVTTVCDCGGPNHLIFALRDAIKDGIIQGPRVLASGYAITTEGGHGDFGDEGGKGSEGVSVSGAVVSTTSRTYIGKKANNAEEVRQAVAEQVEAGADFIKIMATGGGGNPDSQYGLEELQAATAEARRLGKKIVAHCHGAAGIKDALEAGVNVIEHCSFLKQDGSSVFNSDIAEAIMQKKSIYVCPTNTVDYRNWQMLGDSAEGTEKLAPRAQIVPTWRELLRYGVEFIAGSDAGVSQVFCDDYALIMELMVGELSMSPMQAILAGTQVAAEAMGMGDEIGTLEVGKRADLVAVSGNPLEDITALRKIRLVMLGGKVICNL